MISVLFRIALFALFCVAAPAQAQLYKWVDSNGRVQYSDRKPSDGKQSQEVKSTVSSVGSQSGGGGAAAGGKSASELDRDFQKRRQELAEAQQKQQKSAAEQQSQSDSCDAARRNLAALQSGQRISRYDLSGEKSYLDDAGRAKETERSRQIVEQNCK